MSAPRRSVLIVDPDRKFVDGIYQDPRSQQFPPIIAQTGKDAQLALADVKQLFTGVFVNLAVENPHGLSVIRFCHQHRPATPLFLLHEAGPPPLEPYILKQLPILGLVAKPISYAKLLDRITPKEAVFDAERAVAEAKEGRREGIDAEVAELDTSFVPIRAADFVAGSRSFFDVYVRLASGRYIKILQAGDSFTPDRLASYLRKGVENFFLRKEVQERYLSYCDKLVDAVLSSKTVSKEVKVAQTLNLGQETVSYLQSHGLDQTDLHYVDRYSHAVRKLVDQLPSADEPMLKGFLADIAMYEHGVSTSMIAGLLARQLELEADKAVSIVGSASLLHDIALSGKPEAIRAEDESKMSEDQKKIFHLHPAEGAEKLAKLRGVDAAVVQAVAQHHERRNKMGFPRRAGAGVVNRIAEIVGISDEFARLLARAAKDPRTNPLQIMEVDVFPGFSYPVVEAFRKVFMTKML